MLYSIVLFHSTDDTTLFILLRNPMQLFGIYFLRDREDVREGLPTC